VPLSAGRFGLDEYIEHVMQFIEFMGEGSHVLAVCQPTVAALAAVALMSEDGHPAAPASLTLMAGPIDCRISPTSVNVLATSKPIEWFEKNLISTVPWQHGGAGRRVYPGFIQLSAFISMNRERHENAFKDYYRQLVDGDFDRADVTRVFYEEYLAVADLAADFYLETVAKVFQEFALPQGQLMFRGRRIDPAAIRKTALITVEGERDDICAIGQTLAAQDLTSGLRPYMRTHYVQANVGHYGVFSGKRWQTQIYPMVRNVILRAERESALKSACDSVVTGVSPSWRRRSACTWALLGAISSAISAPSTCISDSTARSTSWKRGTLGLSARSMRRGPSGIGRPASPITSRSPWPRRAMTSDSSAWSRVVRFMAFAIFGGAQAALAGVSWRLYGMEVCAPRRVTQSALAA
jgi:hypothetical protein